MLPVYVCSDHRCPLDKEHFTPDEVTFQLINENAIVLYVYRTVPTFVCIFNCVVGMEVRNTYCRHSFASETRMMGCFIAHSNGIHAS